MANSRGQYFQFDKPQLMTPQMDPSMRAGFPGGRAALSLSPTTPFTQRLGPYDSPQAKRGSLMMNPFSPNAGMVGAQPGPSMGPQMNPFQSSQLSPMRNGYRHSTLISPTNMMNPNVPQANIMQMNMIRANLMQNQMAVHHHRQKQMLQKAREDQRKQQEQEEQQENDVIDRMIKQLEKQQDILGDIAHAAANSDNSQRERIAKERVRQRRRALDGDNEEARDTSSRRHRALSLDIKQKWAPISTSVGSPQLENDDNSESERESEQTGQEYPNLSSAIEEEESGVQTPQTEDQEENDFEAKPMFPPEQRPSVRKQFPEPKQLQQGLFNMSKKGHNPVTQHFAQPLVQPHNQPFIKPFGQPIPFGQINQLVGQPFSSQAQMQPLMQSPVQPLIQPFGQQYAQPFVQPCSPSKLTASYPNPSTKQEVSDRSSNEEKAPVFKSSRSAMENFSESEFNKKKESISTNSSPNVKTGANKLFTFKLPEVVQNTKTEPDDLNIKHDSSNTDRTEKTGSPGTKDPEPEKEEKQFKEFTIRRPKKGLTQVQSPSKVSDKEFFSPRRRIDSTKITGSPEEDLALKPTGSLSSARQYQIEESSPQEFNLKSPASPTVRNKWGFSSIKPTQTESPNQIEKSDITESTLDSNMSHSKSPGVRSLRKISNKLQDIESSPTDRQNATEANKDDNSKQSVIPEIKMEGIARKRSENYDVFDSSPQNEVAQENQYKLEEEKNFGSREDLGQSSLSKIKTISLEKKGYANIASINVPRLNGRVPTLEKLPEQRAEIENSGSEPASFSKRNVHLQTNNQKKGGLFSYHLHQNT